MLLALLLLAPQAADPVEGALAEYRRATSAVVHCETPATDEIVICARRDADRYRVPLVLRGASHGEAVPDERARYIRTNTPCEDRGPFLIGCGMVGVSMTTSGNGTKVYTERELAP